MVTIASDDFNRADETLGASGGNWTILDSGDISGIPKIISNVVFRTSTADGWRQYARWDSDTFADDQWCEADVILTTSTPDLQQGSVMVRWAGSGGATTFNDLADGYIGSWENGVGTQAGILRIYICTNDSRQTLVSTTTGIPQTGTHTLKLTAVGTTLKLYFDGVEKLSTTNPTYTGGRPGLNLWGYGTPTASIDNWSAGDMPATLEPRNETHTNNTSTGTSSKAVSYPAYSTGDLLVMGVATDANVAHTAPATGPNSAARSYIINNITPTTAGPHTSVIWWIGNSDEAAGTLTWTLSGNETLSGDCFRVPAGTFDATDPIDVISTCTTGSTGTQTSGTGPTVTAPSMTSTVTDGLVMCFGSVDADAVEAAPTNWSSNAGTRDDGAQNCWVGLRDTLSASTTEAAVTWTAADTAVLVQFVIAPSSGVTDVTGTPTLIAITSATGAVAGTASVTGTATLLAVSSATGQVASVVEVTGTPTLIGVASATGAVTGSAALTGTATALAVTSASGTVAGTASVAGTATLIAVTSASGTVAGTVAVTGTPTVLGVTSASGAVAGAAAITGTPTQLTLTSAQGSIAAQTDMSGTPTVLAITSATGVATATANIIGTPTLIAAESETAVVTATTAVTGTATLIAISSESGLATGAVVVSGTPTLVSLTSAAGVVATVVAVTGTPTVLAITSALGTPLGGDGFGQGPFGQMPFGLGEGIVVVTGIPTRIDLTSASGSVGASGEITGVPTILTIRSGNGPANVAVPVRGIPTFIASHSYIGAVTASAATTGTATRLRITSHTGWPKAPAPLAQTILPFQFLIRGDQLETKTGYRYAQAVEQRDRDLEDYLSTLTPGPGGGWIAVLPTEFQNGWKNKTGAQPVAYRIVGDVVTLRGIADSGFTTNIFILPEGYRPPADKSLATVAGGAFGVITIAVAGQVSASGTNVADGTTLDCTFTVTA